MGHRKIIDHRDGNRSHSPTPTKKEQCSTHLIISNIVASKRQNTYSPTRLVQCFLSNPFIFIFHLMWVPLYLHLKFTYGTYTYSPTIFPTFSFQASLSSCLDGYIFKSNFFFFICYIYNVNFNCHLTVKYMLSI